MRLASRDFPLFEFISYCSDNWPAGSKLRMDSNCITTTGSFQNQTTTSSIAPQPGSWKTPRSQNARSQTAAILATIIYCAIALPRARVVVDDITNEMPAQDTSLKWLKVTVSTQNSSHTFQEPSYSKKSTWNKTLTYLKPIFPVNPVNLKFCGYTILNTFAP